MNLGVHGDLLVARLPPGASYPLQPVTLLTGAQLSGVLPETLELRRVTVPKRFSMPPPEVAVFPDTVEELSVVVPRFSMPPPATLAVLPDTLEELSVVVPVV